MKPELLAPAGDLERLKIAFMYGADAVYIGGNLFSLRANAINFNLDELKEGVKYAHCLNKKVYVTVNIILHNKEIRLIKDYLTLLEKIGVDAIIVSDPTVILLARKHTNLVIHLSTQQSVLNYEAVEFYKNLGVSRIVLGREVSKEDIALIQKKIDIELEIFIHGAMCASFSGRCVLSNYLTKRDANRGGCSQVCRWDFDLYDNENQIQGSKNFTFCSKDLSLLKHIPEIIDMNITSLKIEGRMRSVYYIATVISTYRKMIDDYWNNKDNYEYNEKYEMILNKCANRDSTVQFFNGNYNEECNYYNNRIEISNQDFLGLVIDYDKDSKIATIEQRNYFKSGDIVEFFGPNEEFEYTIVEIKDENGVIDVARHPCQIIYMKVERPLNKNYFMRKRIIC